MKKKRTIIEEMQKKKVTERERDFIFSFHYLILNKHWAH